MLHTAGVWEAMARLRYGGVSYEDEASAAFFWPRMGHGQDSLAVFWLPFRTLTLWVSVSSTWAPKVCKMLAQHLEMEPKTPLFLHSLRVQDMVLRLIFRGVQRSVKILGSRIT